MERSFKTEVKALRLGDGEVFRGEGILAVTKALLQSGVSYVGGYQGAPVSHLLDVLVDAEDIMAELGVHLETCTNEASAAAMLGASINYPLRGAVTWKSIVGTNVAADALSNLASPGVIGGAMIIIGEDYGEGASVIQERSYAYAMKSSMWLLDPRPDLPTIVRCVEKGFALSEASHAPVMLELRIRACHVTGAFTAKNNRAGAYSGLNRLAGPPRFDYARLAHPPVTFVHERLKVESRLPAAQAFIREHKLNEMIPGDLDDIGIIVMGGLTNGLLRALERLGLADVFGASRVPMLVLNVVYPLVPEELRAFCAGKRAVLVVEEGHPEYIEQAVNVELRRADIETRVLGKGPLPKAGEYTAEVLLDGLAAFLAAGAARRRRRRCDRRQGARHPRPSCPRPPRRSANCRRGRRRSAPAARSGRCSARSSSCSASSGPTHISADIGCHSFATMPPFGIGNSILGYGMSLASAAAVGPNMAKRADRGDGRRRLLAQRPDHRRRQQSLQQGRRRARRHAERLHLGDRPAVHAVEPGRPRRRAGHGRRDDAARHGRHLAAQGAHLRRRQHGRGAARGAVHRRARPQGDHRRRRMPAGAPAPGARARTRRSSRAASAWCAPATASTRRSAPATIPASACRAARRSPSSPTPTRCAATRSPP